PRRDAAPLRQLLLGLRHRGRAHRPGRHRGAAPDQQCPHQRGRPEPARVREGPGAGHGGGGGGGDAALRPAAAADGTMAEMTANAVRRSVQRRRRLRLNVFRAAVLTLLATFFLIPIGAMFEFSTRGVGEGAPRTLAFWQSIITYPDLTGAIVVSLELAAITAAAMLLLLVPTMIWVRLRLPQMSRVVESLCLLPLTIPAIALVVGLAPVYL